MGCHFLLQCVKVKSESEVGTFRAVSGYMLGCHSVEKPCTGIDYAHGMFHCLQELAVQLWAPGRDPSPLHLAGTIRRGDSPPRPQSRTHQTVLLRASTKSEWKRRMGLDTGWWTHSSYFSPKWPTCHRRGFCQSTRSFKRHSQANT